MADTVFILGAGASKDAGAPLMLEFLEKAEDLLRFGSVEDAQKEFELVFRSRSLLTRAHSKADIDIKNLEAVFSAFDLARLLKKLGDLTPEQIANDLMPAMRTVIVRTLEEKMEFEPTIDEVGRRGVQPSASDYPRFVELIEDLQHNATLKHSVAIITFNYDVALDAVLAGHGIPIDYGLGQAPQNAIPVLKLHGSLNWANCPECAKVTPYFVQEYLQENHLLFSGNDSPFKLHIGSTIGRHAHPTTDGKRHLLEQKPFLIPPIWNKSEFSKALISVWSRATDELSQAENIFVIGFSLPSTDTFFRDLYAIGTTSDKILRRFWVANPDPDVSKKFQEFLGPGARQAFKSGAKDGFPYFKDVIQKIDHDFLGEENRQSWIS